MYMYSGVLHQDRALISIVIIKSIYNLLLLSIWTTILYSILISHHLIETTFDHNSQVYNNSDLPVLV